MKNYDWILFDIDETLLRFDAYAALQILFEKLGKTLTDEHFNQYEIKNKTLWGEYQKGTITLEKLQYDRFMEIGNQLNIAPLELDKVFLTAITHITTPLEGAKELLNALKGKAKLGLITNGFSDMQQLRITQCGFQDHFNFMVTSDAVGVPKPHPAIFDHAFSLMGNPERKNILIVGDTLESDILGGINVGIDTCWINHHKISAPEHIKPHYEITSLLELKKKLQQ